MDLPPSFCLTIGATLPEITRAGGWLMALAHEGAIENARLHDMQLCLEEALANIVLHGMAEIDDPLIEIEIMLLPGRILLDITDNGPAFDPCTKMAPPVPPSIEEAAIGGRGIPLMRLYSSAMRYAREDDRNHLTLTFDHDAR